MSRISNFKKAEKNIVSFISEKSVYSISDLRKIFRDKKEEWSLPAGMHFINFLQELQNMGLSEHHLRDFDGFSKKIIYTWGKFDYFECSGRFYNNSYLSHHSALFLNNLTEQIPKTMYVSYELSGKIVNNAPVKLLQKDVDSNFSKSAKDPRQFSFDRKPVIIHASKYSGNLGVIPYGEGKVLFTDKERTLIDSVVRPDFSGGIFNVLRIFKENKGSFSVNRIRAYLVKLNYVYPYHQVIGFLLERSGYLDSKLSLFEDIGIKNKFYIDREIRNPVLSKRWNLVYPAEFDE